MEAIDIGLPEISALEKEKIKTRFLPALFPRLRGVFGKSSFSKDEEDRWEKEQRVSSEYYFKRYFSYGVLWEDVPDIKISQFLNLLISKPEEASTLFTKICKGNGIRHLVRKLRLREDEIDPAVSGSLARIVATNGELIPNEKGLLSDETRSQAGILVAHLIKKIAKEDERYALARYVVTLAVPLPFALECWRWLSRYARQSEKERIIEVEYIENLGKILAQRIRDETVDLAIYLTYPNDAKSLLWVWKKYETDDEVRPYLEERLVQNTAEIDSFLISFVGTAYSSESESHPGDMDRSSYDEVEKLIDPDFVLAKLRERYGGELDQPEYNHSRDFPVSRRIAHQFASIHKIVVELNSQTTKEKEEGTSQNESE